LLQVIDDVKRSKQVGPVYFEFNWVLFWTGVAIVVSLGIIMIINEWRDHKKNEAERKIKFEAEKEAYNQALIWNEYYQKQDVINANIEAAERARLAAERKKADEEIEARRRQERLDRAMADRLKAQTAAEERFRQILRDKRFELDVGQGIDDPEVVAQAIRSALTNSSWLSSDDAMLLSLSTDQTIRETLGPLIARLPKPPPLLG